MAAPTVKTGIFEYGTFNVLVSFKVMRSVRYRISRYADNVVEMSVPYTMTDSQVEKMLADLYPAMQKLSDKVSRQREEAVVRPDAKTLAHWKERLSVLIPLIEKEMNLAARSYSLRYMRTRWGSCSPLRKTISLNSALASLPEECTHYVIVHELSHLVHPDHSPSFWLHVERYFPEYRKIRNFLRKKAVN